MAICFYKQSLEVLATLSSFKVNMTFKRVKDSDINKVVFAAFLPSINKGKDTLIYYKCITNRL